jgi:hypothetical protein
MSTDGPTGIAGQGPKPLSAEVVAASIIFGLLGPGFLSLRYMSLFGPNHQKLVEYPWVFPAWSYGITILKMAALVVWMVLGRRRCRWPLGILAGVFFVGGLHALGCGLANNGFQREGFWVATHVQLAYASGLTYLFNSVLVVRRLLASRARPWPGFLLGVGIAAGLPAAAEYLLCGPL